MVVRFNGGAQAGHTVQTTEGRRHVFSHFGAGSFAGWPTYLSQFFIANPILFFRELSSLQALGVNPSVLLDYRTRLSTPYDILINQAVESRRGASRHGSCGIGINETVTRCGRAPEFKTSCSDLHDMETLYRKLKVLGKAWVPLRLQELGLSRDTEEIQKFLAKEDDIISQFAAEAHRMLKVCQITNEYPTSSRIIFEGAQGLMLDEDRVDQWPYVTHSKTGLHNVCFLANRLKVESLDVTYVSRTYLTRHGAGPLPGESDSLIAAVDRTNVPNRFQGSLRFAAMDWGQLNESIALDLRQSKNSGLNINAGLALTCCDQLPPRRVECALPLKLVSYGPSREEVEQVTSERKALSQQAFGQISSSQKGQEQSHLPAPVDSLPGPLSASSR
jgi:adenylosuccinate synthase